MASALTINGKVKVTFYSAIKDFGQGKQGSVTVFLREFNPTNSTYTTLCQGTMTQSNWQGGSSTWVAKTLDIDCVNKTLAAGRRLEVKFIVGGNSGDDMWFAYDTKTSYETRTELP
jgi:hypothetical protein